MLCSDFLIKKLTRKRNFSIRAKGKRKQQLKHYESIGGTLQCKPWECAVYPETTRVMYCEFGGFLVISQFEKYCKMKKLDKDYWLILDDEAHLERVARMRLTPMRVVIIAVCALIISCMLGFIITAATPLKYLLPGYLEESQRAAGEETMLRLDSLRTAYDRNTAYISNLRSILNDSRSPQADSLEMSLNSNRVVSDSLMGAGSRETDFVKQMREREKYNISILAPLSAEGILFYPPSEDGVISNDTRAQVRAHLLIPAGSTVSAVADGTVLSVSNSISGATIIIQHPKGFVSRLTGLQTPLIGEGDRIYGGQAIALSPAPSKIKGRGEVYLEMWHNGNPLIPDEYITPSSRKQ